MPVPRIPTTRPAVASKQAEVSKPKEKKEKPEGEAKPAEAEDGTTKSPDQ